MRPLFKALERVAGGGVAIDIVKCYHFILSFYLLKVHINHLLIFSLGRDLDNKF